MNVKYVNEMPLVRQKKEFAREIDLALSAKTMVNWIINCADRYLKHCLNGITNKGRFCGQAFPYW